MYVAFYFVLIKNKIQTICLIIRNTRILKQTFIYIYFKKDIYLVVILMIIKLSEIVINAL